ncbi:MAG: DUF1761 domain-containing protein [Marinilabiliales bacterium]|nr:DUF1761 domain-containing protein [Marinilabiliales bacterium]
MATLTNVNIWAVLLAGFAYLLIGALWYSPLLFGKQWIRLNNFTEADLKGNKPMWMITLVSFISGILISYVISIPLGPHSNGTFGALIGFIIAVFWISTSKLTSVLFENKPFKLYLIHAGFDVVAFMVMGSIVGYWR